MKWAAIALLTLLTACSQSGSNAPASSQQLSSEQGSAELSELISSGAVSLVQARGNGASSGNSIDAVLRNNTERELQINVFLDQPIFLANSGVGQNMIASMVVGDDGSYKQEGSRSIVTLRPSEPFKASMVAYCADFSKENPNSTETFDLSQVPPRLAAVISRVNEYARSNPDVDVTVAAQLAVWLAQDESTVIIAEKFPFTPADEQLARTFLK